MRYALVCLALVAATAHAQPADWQPVPLSVADVADLQVLADGTVVVASRGGLQRSFDGGDTWERWLTTQPLARVAYAPGEVLFIGSLGRTLTDGVYRAVARTAAWGDLGSGGLVYNGNGLGADPDTRLTDLVHAPDGRGWASAGDDVFAYPGSGFSWSRATLSVTDVLALHRGAGGALWAGTTDGVFAGGQDGTAWTPDGLSDFALWEICEVGHDWLPYKSTMIGPPPLEESRGLPAMIRVDNGPE